MPNRSRNNCSLANKIEPLSPKNIPQSEWASKSAPIMITMTAPPDNLVIKFPITGALNPINRLIGLSAPVIGNLITRLSGGAVMVIMIGALLLAHSDWGIFFGERGSILFASEQLFLLLLGTYFAIKGNDQ